MRAHSKVVLGLGVVLAVMGTIAPARPDPLQTLSLPDSRFGALVYHRVNVNPGCSSSPGCCDVSERKFLGDIDQLISRGYVFVTFKDILRNDYDPRQRNLILSFDDGTDSHFDVVRPALNERGIKGVFYVITGRVGQAGFLDWSQIQVLVDQGHEIGAHTVHHPELIRLTEEEILFELSQSKADLEYMLHGPQAEPYEVVSFAYPYCLRNEEIVQLLEANGWYAFAVDCGLAYNSWANLSLYPFTLNRMLVTEGARISYLF